MSWRLPRSSERVRARMQVRTGKWQRPNLRRCRAGAAASGSSTRPDANFGRAGSPHSPSDRSCAPARRPCRQASLAAKRARGAGVSRGVQPNEALERGPTQGPNAARGRGPTRRDAARRGAGTGVLCVRVQCGDVGQANDGGASDKELVHQHALFARRVRLDRPCRTAVFTRTILARVVSVARQYHGGDVWWGGVEAGGSGEVEGRHLRVLRPGTRRRR